MHFSLPPQFAAWEERDVEQMTELTRNNTKRQQIQSIADLDSMFVFEPLKYNLSYCFEISNVTKLTFIMTYVLFKSNFVVKLGIFKFWGNFKLRYFHVLSPIRISCKPTIEVGVESILCAVTILIFYLILL